MSDEKSFNVLCCSYVRSVDDKRLLHVDSRLKIEVVAFLFRTPRCYCAVSIVDCRDDGRDCLLFFYL